MNSLTDPYAQNLCEPVYETEPGDPRLPADRIDAIVRAACNAIADIRTNAIGALADELITEGFPAGQVYRYIAEQMTNDGEPTHWRSIQNWCNHYRYYGDLKKEFPRLPHAAFPLASEIGNEINFPGAKDILRWQDRDGDMALKPYTCEQVKAHFLPAPAGYSMDEPPFLFKALRWFTSMHLDTDPEISAWLQTGRELIRRKLGK